ncbi:hypothetical protein NAP1_02110 [Erythrobacter sp. NAP1]|uniref:hypothetical protein n=1 Tax=Erythrobacter sp. NAP1 TaxID=237727 RepID=UPI0000686976|nr:hypothetical protein [Erythrobacter sp. NAP1]EAQ29528.1 hypothetical protein NAP1_02110 [Erythrobacter sp. NAP1]
MKSYSCKFVLTGTAVLTLAACAGDSDRYPSLAIRDAERASGQFTPVQTPAPAAITPADRASIGAALEQARSTHEQFMAQQPAALSLARSASGRGNDSDVRSRALVAVASLSSLRGQTAIALADLDRMEVEAATSFAAIEDIRTAQSYVARLAMEQDEMLETLSEVMR